MDERELQQWKDFEQSGRVTDYLRYRGVDLYAHQATDCVSGEEQRDGSRQPTASDDRGSGGAGV